MTYYTFSVVATNSLGSGEAGVVMITTPGEYNMQVCGANVCGWLCKTHEFDLFQKIKS